MTMTVLISALFVAGTAFALATMAVTLRAYWPAVLALRDAERWQNQHQEVRVTISSTSVDLAGNVLHPDFRTRQLASYPEWRAAA